MKHISICFIANILCVSIAFAQQKIPLAENKNLTVCKISDYASLINYVALETTDECLLGEEIQVISTAQYIFVYDQIERKMYRFDIHTGKYLNKIGKRGQGPGEYTRLFGFYVDDTEKKCFLLDNTGIFIYNYEGIFLKKNPIPEGYCPTRMEKIGNYYILNNMLYLDTKKELYLLDQQGRKVREKALSGNPQTGFILPTPFFYKMDGQCYYKNDLSEAIYLIDEKLNMTPVYQIDCGSKAINPKENQYDLKKGEVVKGKITFGRISGYNNHLYIPYFVENKRLLAIYDIQTSSVITAGQEGRSGITDDLTYGPMILPPTNTSLYQSCVPGQLISWFFPANINRALYQKGKFGEALKPLEEDSNPIVQIIQLK